MKIYILALNVFIVLIEEKIIGNMQIRKVRKMQMTNENEKAIKLLMELRICKDDCSVCKLRHLDGDTHCHHEKALNLAIKALEQQSNRCDSCVHSEEQDGSNCYECVKGMADNFKSHLPQT